MNSRYSLGVLHKLAAACSGCMRHWPSSFSPSWPHPAATFSRAKSPGAADAKVLRSIPSGSRMSLRITLSKLSPLTCSAQYWAIVYPPPE